MLMPDTIVAESHELGVGETASRYSLSKTQLFTWRRNAQEASDETGFARVVVGDAAPAGGIIEVRMRGGELRVKEHRPIDSKGSTTGSQRARSGALLATRA